jgi:hypothetical protein
LSRESRGKGDAEEKGRCGRGWRGLLGKRRCWGLFKGCFVEKEEMLELVRVFVRDEKMLEVTRVVLEKEKMLGFRVFRQGLLAKETMLELV